MTLIDTSAWIEFYRARGDPRVKSRVAAYIELGEAAHCGPVAFELFTGARGAEVGEILEGFGFSHLLDFPFACWVRAAEVEKGLRRRGVTVPRDDVLVAAAAIYHGVPLYAQDTHFSAMRDRGGLPLDLAP